MTNRECECTVRVCRGNITLGERSQTCSERAQRHADMLRADAMCVRMYVGRWRGKAYPQERRGEDDADDLQQSRQEASALAPATIMAHLQGHESFEPEHLQRIAFPGRVGNQVIYFKKEIITDVTDGFRPTYILFSYYFTSPPRQSALRASYRFDWIPFNHMTHYAHLCMCGIDVRSHHRGCFALADSRLQSSNL